MRKLEPMENEPSRVLEQNVFEDVYHLGEELSKFTDDVKSASFGHVVREFERVECLDNGALCVGNASDEESEEMAPLRSALKVPFFLAVMSMCEEEAKENAAMGVVEKQVGGGKKKSNLAKKGQLVEWKMGRATRTRDARHEWGVGRGFISRFQTKTGGSGRFAGCLLLYRTASLENPTSLKSRRNARRSKWSGQLPVSGVRWMTS